MRRLLPLIAIALVAVSGAGVAVAHGGADHRVSADQANGPTIRLALPSTLPVPAGGQHLTYGFRSEAAIAAPFEVPRRAAAADGSRTTSTGGSASATVVVTAIVLPVRTIVVSGGIVTQIWSNSAESPTRTLYAVHHGSEAGPLVRLTPAVWVQVRAILAQPHASTGLVYVR